MPSPTRSGSPSASTSDVPSIATLGEYKVIRDIGEGTFGKVKLAVHTVTNHRVAMKFISKAKIHALRMKMRVTREIEYLRMLNHPHIIKLYEVISTATDIVMVLEYAGGELFQYIVDHGRMSEGSTRRAFQQMVFALSYSHTSLRIVHRDLKPENVLLDDDLNVKIADFGLSNEISDGDFLRTSCGSPNYAAPEVISGKLYAGPEIDVWSCGVILYVMLCGRLPFEDEHVPTLFHKISSGMYHVPSYVTPEAKSLIAGMLAVDPVKRLTVPEVLLHPWTRIDMPHYLVRVLPIVRPFMGALSSLVKKKSSSIIAGIGKLDAGVLDELSGTLNVNKEDLEDALKLEGENAVKVAYKLCRDRRRLGKDLSEMHLDEEDEDADDAKLPLEPMWDPINRGPTRVDSLPGSTDEVYYDQDYEDDEDEDDGSNEGETDWKEENNFAVLDSSLVNQQTGDPPSPSPLFGPAQHHLASYANSRSSSAHQQTSSSKESRLPPSPRPRHPKQPKWHFGIRSRSPPMEVILELYQTLKALGMEWREKGGEWGMKGTEEVDSDSYGKESMDIYFVETRWRVRDVVVRMDLQLYQVDPANYLVDFRNMGYYKASTSPTAKSPFERRAPSASSSPSSPSSEGSQNSADSKREREPGEPEHHTRDKKPVDISNAFLFLECACRLIIELAGG